ncbi:MAG: thioredoxin family protein [Candidatus Marinimicrobia bacterium]|nr:thioredoxin family protein [Candidatus Neomarinimicrobiota bacterium]
MNRSHLQKILFIFALTTIFSLNIFAAENILDLQTFPSTNAVQAGGDFKIAIEANIHKPWHINSNQPLDDYTIGTEVRLDESDNYSVTDTIFPEHEIIKNEALDKELALFSGKTVIVVQGNLSENLNADTVVVKGSLYYQGCNDATCLAPQEDSFEARLPVAKNQSNIETINQEYFSDIEEKEIAQETRQSSSEKSFNVSQSFSKRGTFLTFLLIFLGGLGLVLTPCIYPMIPITVSYFGGQAEGKKSKRFVMALLYVLGLATTNSVLGTVAALSGGLVGGLLSNPIVLLGIALVLVALALSMFGLYDISLPSAMNQLGSGTEGGYLGSIIMGLTLGIVAAPCIGPFIIGLLTYVAAVGNAFLGFAMFFTLSIGMGLPFLILAYFSSQIDKLPNAGEWMVGVRKIFGLILLGMALYFLQALIPDNIYKFLFPLFILGAGVYLIIFEKSGDQNRIFAAIKRVIAIIAIFTAGWLMKPEAESISGSMTWQPYNQTAYEKALQDDKPVIMDFSAEWCVKCKELEEITFKAPQVVEKSKKFHLFKVDLTNRNSEKVENIREKFDIKGLPTVIFINSEGQERRDLRIFGFVKPEIFAEKMELLIEK